MAPVSRARLRGGYDRVADRLPPALASRVDWWALARSRTSDRSFNDQVGRRQIVRDLFAAIPFTSVLETGSYRGSSTAVLAELTSAPVRSVECRERFRMFASRRLSGSLHASSELGDSRPFLARALAQGPGPVFVYLDAHWYDDLPLADELRVIADSGVPSVVMIDDFRVDDDPGYAYDDYGPGRSLEAVYVDAVSEVAQWPRFVPTLPSSQETGARRGCVVLVHPELAETVSAVPSLRSAVSAAGG